MAASDSSSSSKKLDQTPTWAVAAVCTVFILISIALEKSLHKVGTVSSERKPEFCAFLGDLNCPVSCLQHGLKHSKLRLQIWPT